MSTLDLLKKSTICVHLKEEKFLLGFGKPIRSNSFSDKYLSFFCSDFFLQEKLPWYLFKEWKQVELKEEKSFFLEESGYFFKEKQFKKKVQAVLKSDLKKAVVSESCHYKGSIDPKKAFLNVVQNSAHPLRPYAFFAKEGFFWGNT